MCEQISLSIINVKFNNIAVFRMNPELIMFSLIFFHHARAVHKQLLKPSKPFWK